MAVVGGTHWTAEEDDNTAREIERKLEIWGAALFEAVFKSADKAMELYRNFRDSRETNRLLTVSSGDPLILSLPWELLKPPGGVFLCNENPRISIRRKHGKTGEGRTPLRREVKPALHILFVVSRPTDASFINPYTDAKAVLNSLSADTPVMVEFLRPATLKALGERLRDQDKAVVDVLHFDGHGAFDTHGGLKERADRHLPDSVQGLLREAEQRGNAMVAPDKQGYLLFENEHGKMDLVSAKVIGELLYQQSIGLVVLSACQSARMGEEAMGSVSAWLVHAGIASVIAMTHSVLVKTTEKLFGTFYQALIKGKPVGAALDDARSVLYFDPARGERIRNNEPVTLKLYDWFLPALYQSGRDDKLLQSTAPLRQAQRTHHNLPALQESGFYGRTPELWQIERAFGVEGTQRFSISGFGGQGKTTLATEAARWLLRSHLFERAVLVSYAAFQGEDAVGFAVSTMGSVLEKSLLDANAAFAALNTEPTLVILDNLETLASCMELLNTAAQWSENSSNIRILLTSRLPDFHHIKYPTRGSFKHQHRQLTGLAPQDALDWLNQLLRLPPGRDRGLPPLKRVGLLELLAKVAFHPLSIGLLAKVLQSRSLADVSPRLSELLAQENGDNAGLLASLNLSLDRLGAAARAWLPNLAVFHGGVFEPVLVAVTKADNWAEIRALLLHTGLIQTEDTGIGAYLRFHPTLAPALANKLPPPQLEILRRRHRQAYYQLSGKLYHLNDSNPHAARAVARRELPNLLAAVDAALDAKDEDAVDFAASVNKFLNAFGLSREHERLAARAAQVGGARGSQSWYLARSGLGQQLWNAGRATEAQAVFLDLLDGLGDTPSYKRCTTLGWLGRCLRVQGQLGEAAAWYRQELAELAGLEQSQNVKRLTGCAHTDLGDVLRDLGDYLGARAASQAAQAICTEQGDARQMGVVNSQLGYLALQQGQLAEAAQRYQAELATFRQFKEPGSEAVIHHQLGMIYQTAEQWEAAEQAYREAARLDENKGNLQGAATSWNNLAAVTESAGKAAEAEGWYRKAIAGSHTVNKSKALNNLANLLLNLNQKHRLAEARQLAEQAVAIQETLDPVGAEIWTTYAILARIAEREDKPEEAAQWRAKRQAVIASLPPETRQNLGLG